MIVLPPLRTSRISSEEIQASDINSRMRTREGKTPQREVLAVRQIRPYTHRYFPIKLLIYGDVDRGEVELVAVVDGDASSKHDGALNEIGGAASLGVNIGHPEKRPMLPAELEAIRIPVEQVAELRSATINGRIAASDREAAAISDPDPTSQEELSLSKISVRSVSVFEHRELLAEALETARTRILIISPWIKSAVVDGTFLARLERRLRLGVAVTIAYGIGDSDNGSDQAAIQELRHIEARYPKFDFVRLQNTHAKVLVFDDRWVVTSFNWLSFRGDPERTYRMEEGTLVQIPGQVTEQYERYLELVREQARR